ncbi:MAG: hypothetical protein OXG05_01540 [Gammaproteobacteria bacterium]|nr:hypothetical protein [Gammaproteobacteria bacterium]
MSAPNVIGLVVAKTTYSFEHPVIYMRCWHNVVAFLNYETSLSVLPVSFLLSENILAAASRQLRSLIGQVFDVITLSKPKTNDAVVNLTKIISKLSPLVGNLIEFEMVDFLNSQHGSVDFGTWVRQDPGFPDALFVSHIKPSPGFEIKAWFPLATEITARFRESQYRLQHEETNICILAWLPERIIFGRPQIIDVCVVSALSVAESRDLHYHNPPDYLVIEPEDTSSRTKNLQQTNTAGYRFQGTEEELRDAKRFVEESGLANERYRTELPYQNHIRELRALFPYRLDTNFAKIDRIDHEQIERFKNRVMGTRINEHTIREWGKVLLGENDEDKLEALTRLLI